MKRCQGNRLLDGPDDRIAQSKLEFMKSVLHREQRGVPPQEISEASSHDTMLLCL